jgi:hypothetical protein
MWEWVLRPCRAQVNSPEDTTALEEYWEQHKLKPNARPSQLPEDSSTDDLTRRTNGYHKARTMSTATTFIAANHALTPHHPALALISSIKLFGPLIFPIYRAALLRKRILIVTDTPVEFACNLGRDWKMISRTNTLADAAS